MAIEDCRMTSEQLRQVIRAQPFRPFAIHLADGRQIRVNHPELVLKAPTGRTFVVWGPDDAFEIIDLFLVSSIKVTDGKARARKK